MPTQRDNLGEHSLGVTGLLAQTRVHVVTGVSNICDKDFLDGSSHGEAPNNMRRLILRLRGLLPKL